MRNALSFEIEKRLATPRWLQMFTPFVSLLLALTVIGIVFVALGIDPFFAYGRILGGAFGSLYSLSETVSINL